MNIGENLRGGLSEIWGHKLRSALTLVGVVLGVFSINCMFSIVQGVRTAISSVFETIGFDGMVFMNEKGLEREQRTAWNLASDGLTTNDADALRQAMLGRARVSPITQFLRLVDHDGKTTLVKFEAGNEDYIGIRNFKLEKGRELLLADVIGMNPVAVIGPKVATDLFGKQDPIGKEIPVDGLRYRVVGVLKKSEMPRGMGGGGDMFEGNTVYIPISSAKAYVLGKESGVAIALKANKDANLERMVSDAETMIYRRHRGAHDVEVENIGEEMLREREDVDKMLGNFNIVLGCIAGAALLTGGIGILSVMLIAVHERLFEIGIRKAVGATDNEILMQFLVEASTLSMVGAVAGTGLAVVAVSLLSPKFPWGLEVSSGGLSLAAFFAIAIGLGFGLYPAWLASRMDPVESLRAS